MYDIFSLKRFSLSLRRLFVEKGIKMIGSILIILFVMVLFMNINFAPGFYSEIRMFFLVLALMFGPVLYMSVVANEFTNHSKGISYLLMPNSTFEKWLTNNVIVIAIFYIVFGLLFRLVDLWMIGRLNANFGLAEGKVTPVEFASDIFVISGLIGTAISLGILLGSHYFKKNSMIISLLLMFGLFMFAFFLDYIFANMLFDGQVLFGDSAPFGPVSVTDPSSAVGHYHLDIPITARQLITYTFVPIIAGLSLTYFVRLKEKQL
ncbi:MAG: hypothetical protein GQ574_06065 [Crocinitomix sp.]|nr:hypothetical protein [Crocinitomix sp.]